MDKDLRKLIILKCFSIRLKLVFGLLCSVFLFFIGAFFLHDAKADNILYSEDFSTVTYKDTANTTARWIAGGSDARLWGYESGDMAKTLNGFENISNTPSGASNDAYCIALDSNNNPYVVWIDNGTGLQDIYFSYWNGTTWKGLDDTDGIPGYDNLANSTGLSWDPRIEISNADTPLVTWTDNTGGRNVRITKWTPGIGWTQMDGVTLGHERVPGSL